MNKEMILIIAGAAVATYCTRFPLLVLTGKKVPQWVEAYLRYLAPAILTALTAPFVLIKNGAINVSLKNDYLLAAVITGVIAYFSKKTLIAVLAGVLTAGLTMWLYTYCI